eukprot:GHVT01085822.1.p1 GENE.GHVT01085822.1~~GHVT01085822.1.p1  ORF type:complete len:171 (-),score=7.08 GHVT01085822.1:207-719(-)
MMDGIRRRFKKFLCVTQRVSGEEVSVVKAASEVRTTHFRGSPNITATNDHECFAFPGLETLAAQPWRRKLLAQLARPFLQKSAKKNYVKFGQPQSIYPGVPCLVTVSCCHSGVGRKVADCISLFAFDHRNIVPVDGHVWRVACRDFDETLNTGFQDSSHFDCTKSWIVVR